MPHLWSDVERRASPPAADVGLRRVDGTAQPKAAGGNNALYPDPDLSSLRNPWAVGVVHGTRQRLLATAVQWLLPPESTRQRLQRLPSSDVIRVHCHVDQLVDPTPCGLSP